MANPGEMIGYRGVLANYSTSGNVPVEVEERKQGDIKVIEALEKKWMMEMNILDAINQFEAETGLLASDITLLRDNEEETVTKVSVNVRL